MIERAKLEEFHRRQVEINKQQATLTDEFQKYKRELYRKAIEVLDWEDKNLGKEFLRYKWEARGQIHEIRANCVVVRIPDTDSELPAAYYSVSFDKLYSDDWKELALAEHERKKQQALEEERAAKEKAAADKEARERAEYERLKAKFESK